MDPVGVLPEGEWNSFSGMFTTEEAEFMVNLLGNCPLPNEQDLGMSLGAPSNFWPGHEASTNMAIGDESSYYCSDAVNSDSFFFPQGSNYSSDTSSLFIPNSVDENYLINSNSIFLKNNSSVTMNIGTIAQKNANSSVEVFSNNLTEEALCMNEELNRKNLGDNGENPPEAVIFPNKKLQPRMKSEIPEVVADVENENTILLENPKKRSRASGDVPKNKKNVQSKKKRKLVGTNNEEEESNGDVNGQSSSSYCSEDDSNVSQEVNGGATSSSKGPATLNSNGKTRANRGSATDPQSLYARKRRERINERLRILQNLIPNGTKVDISTMLEEAVEYVKFLQLQIKLLSSDDLWMYSPIAYNGMSLGLDLKIAPP